MPNQHKPTPAIECRTLPGAESPRHIVFYAHGMQQSACQVDADAAMLRRELPPSVELVVLYGPYREADGKRSWFKRTLAPVGRREETEVHGIFSWLRARRGGRPATAPLINWQAAAEERQKQIQARLTHEKTEAVMAWRLYKVTCLLEKRIETYLATRRRRVKSLAANAATLIGFSQGGFVASYAAYRLRSIAGLVCIQGGWEGAPHGAARALNLFPVRSRPQSLYLFGGKDRLVSACMHGRTRHAVTEYGLENSTEFDEDPHAGHTLTETHRKQACRFVKRLVHSLS